MKFSIAFGHLVLQGDYSLAVLLFTLLFTHFLCKAVMNANFWRSIASCQVYHCSYRLVFFFPICFWPFGEVTEGTCRNRFKNIANWEIIWVEERGVLIQCERCDQYRNLCVSKYVSLLIIGNDLLFAGNRMSSESVIIYYSFLWHIKTSRKEVMDSRLKTQHGNYFILNSGELVKSNSLCLIAWVHELSDSVLMQNSSSITLWKYYVQIKHM